MANLKRVAGRKARKYGIDPRIFKRQIRQESGFNAHARSPAGAQGVAQIMPATAASWHVNPNNPRAALDAAAKHMADYLRAYHGSWAKALTAYNAGPGAVGRGLPAETQGYIRNILGGHNDVKNSPGPSLPGGGSRQTAIPGRWSVKLQNQQQFDAPAFKAARASFVVGQLVAKHRGTDNPLFKTGLLTTSAPSPGDFQSNALSSTLVKHQGRIVTSGGGGNVHGSNVEAMLARAEAWDRAKVPYSWGGGHGGRPAKPGTPVDCSGYVSAILGVNPMVSGALANWGRPGRGKQVTVYANSGHVLINIGHRWFATSHSNPGGGAGEISRPTASYLAAFRARHPRGL